MLKLYNYETAFIYRMLCANYINLRKVVIFLRITITFCLIIPTYIIWSFKYIVEPYYG